MNVKPRRRWFRFSLRTLLLLVTIASSGFSWLGYTIRQAQRQQEAVQALKLAGGTVYYDYEIYNELSPPGPAWLRIIMGNEFFADAVAVHMSSTTIPNGALAHLQELPKLDFLDLSMTAVADADLVHLQSLKELRKLHLSNTLITDAGLTYLRGLALLDYLNVSGTQVSPAGCQELQQALATLTIVR